MNLNQFAIETFPDWIGFLLVVACALWLGWECLVSYCDRQPIVEEARFPVNETANVAEIMMHMGLMNELPDVRRNQGMQNFHPTPGYIEKYNRDITNAIPQEWPIDPAHIDNLLRQAGASDAERADILRGTKFP